MKIVALEHLSDGRFREKLHQVREAELVEPFGVVAQRDALQIQHFARLLAVGVHVGFDFLRRQLRARNVLPARIADARREVADDQRDVVTRFRKALKLVQHDHEAEVQIGARRIDSELNVERTAELQTRFELGGRFDVVESVE